MSPNCHFSSAQLGVVRHTRLAGLRLSLLFHFLANLTQQVSRVGHFELQARWFQLQHLCFNHASIPQFHRPRSSARANDPFG